MATILIVYVTRQGQTQKIAARMAQVLRAWGHGVEMIDAEQPYGGLQLYRFDRFIIGAPILAGGYPRAVARFVRKHRALLERAPSAFFSVGLTIASRTRDGCAQTQAVVDRFLKRTGFHPARVELLAGGLPYTRYNFFIRFVMRRIAAKEGGDTDTTRDYEYTNWDAVEQFAVDFVNSDVVNGPRVVVPNVAQPRPAPAARRLRPVT
jgi:menaquinone-dependent protoporphyrinogen oxidase